MKQLMNQDDGDGSEYWRPQPVIVGSDETRLRQALSVDSGVTAVDSGGGGLGGDQPDYVNSSIETGADQQHYVNEMAAEEAERSPEPYYSSVV